MAGKRAGFWGTAVLALSFGMLMTSCASISKENIGSFPVVDIPAKDFTSLGLVFTESVVANSKGEVFTYNALLKEAQKLGADSIINVVIDVKREGTKIGFLYLDPRETWYGSATAIKYTDSLKEITTSNPEGVIVTKEGSIVSGKGGGEGASSSGGSAGGKKFLGRFPPLPFNFLSW
jgi:hypothetical protein